MNVLDAQEKSSREDLIHPDVFSHGRAWHRDIIKFDQGMKMNYWQPKYELMAREELEELQLRRLKSIVEKVYRNVAFYQKKFQQAAVTPQDINSLADISRLPTTRK